MLKLKMHALRVQKVKDFIFTNPVWEQELAALPEGAQPSRTIFRRVPWHGKKSSPLYLLGEWSSRTSTITKYTQLIAYT